MTRRNPARDYHDYVFKGGCFIGRFDDMYQYSRDVPWHQDRMALLWYSQVGLLMIRDIVAQRGKPFAKILDVGCGLGYLTAQLSPFAKSVTGCDLSKTAVTRAAQKHGSVNFFVWDVRGPLIQRDKFDLVVMTELMWYVLDKADAVRNNIMALLKKRGYFLLKQSFPDLRKPYVGRKIFPHPQAMIDFWGCFKIVFSCEIIKPLDGDGPHLWLLGRKK